MLEPMVAEAEDVSKMLAKQGGLDSAPRGIRTHDPRFRRLGLGVPCGVLR